jgi:L,D-transpeptidase ErfK/SrfK
MKPLKLCRPICCAIALGVLWMSVAFADAFEYRLPDERTSSETWTTVVGVVRLHTVAPKETLLDIARNYGLGFNEIQLFHPDADPWIPEPGSELAVPTKWVLPPTRHEGIVINIPEMRLYRFFPKIKVVKTYPIGIGAQETPTPEGTNWVVDRSVYPTWTIPDSLRSKYPVAAIPPGPDNPLGKYWLGISRKGYGIHGTNFPWCVGRSVSNGCIRLYPEHIEQLFQETPVMTRVEIIYEPVKVGFQKGRIFVEVHPDIYGRIQGMEEHAIRRLQESVSLKCVSIELLRGALADCRGVPVPVGSLFDSGGRGTPLVYIDGRARSVQPSINGNQQTGEEKEG